MYISNYVCQRFFIHFQWCNYYIDPYEAHRLMRIFRNNDGDTMPEWSKFHREDEENYTSMYQKHNLEIESLMQLVLSQTWKNSTKPGLPRTRKYVEFRLEILLQVPLASISQGTAQRVHLASDLIKHITGLFLDVLCVRLWAWMGCPQSSRIHFLVCLFCAVLLFCSVSAVCHQSSCVLVFSQLPGLLSFLCY